MRKCPECGRESGRERQNHDCLKPQTIDEYINASEENLRPRLRQMRDILRAALPETEERISWSMPTFRKGKNIIHFAGFQNHTGLYPGDEAVAAFSAKLERYSFSKGTIRFPHSAELPAELITEIAQWCLRRYGEPEGKQAR